MCSRRRVLLYYVKNDWSAGPKNRDTQRKIYSWILHGDDASAHNDLSIRQGVTTTLPMLSRFCCAYGD